MNKLLLYRQSVEPRPFERDCVREREREWEEGGDSFIKNLGERRVKEKKRIFSIGIIIRERTEDGIGAGERSGID